MIDAVEPELDRRQCLTETRQSQVRVRKRNGCLNRDLRCHLLILLAFNQIFPLGDNYQVVVPKCKGCDAFIYSAEAANCRAVLAVMR